MLKTTLAFESPNKSATKVQFMQILTKSFGINHQGLTNHRHWVLDRWAWWADSLPRSGKLLLNSWYFSLHVRFLIPVCATLTIPPRQVDCRRSFCKVQHIPLPCPFMGYEVVEQTKLSRPQKGAVSLAFVNNNESTIDYFTSDSGTV